MEFDQVEPGEVYYAVTDGQFIGLFYCVEKKGKYARFICSFYADTGVRNKIFDKMAFDWEFELDPDENLPDDSFAADMRILRSAPHSNLTDYYEEFIKDLFEDVNNEIY